MRLRLPRLSFGSVRAVELMSTVDVFLADRCHRISGIRSIWVVSQVSLLGFPGMALEPFPDIGLRVSLCAS